MSKKAKIARSQKTFLEAMKRKFSEEPEQPKNPEISNPHPTIIVGGI